MRRSAKVPSSRGEGWRAVGWYCGIEGVWERTWCWRKFSLTVTKRVFYGASLTLQFMASCVFYCSCPQECIYEHLPLPPSPSHTYKVWESSPTFYAGLLQTHPWYYVCNNHNLAD